MWREDQKWDDNELIASFNLQKVIMLPKLPGLELIIFCKLISLFNEVLTTVSETRHIALSEAIEVLRVFFFGWAIVSEQKRLIFVCSTTQGSKCKGRICRNSNVK